MPSRRLSAALIVTVVAASGAAALASSPALAATPSRSPVPNAQPDLSGAKAGANADASQRIDVTLYLAPRNVSALDDAVKAVSTPGSSSYGKYLTPAQFRSTYAPTAKSADAVTSFLTDAGLAVTEVPDNRFYVTAEGTVAQVQKAFGTTLRSYALGGQDVRAAASAPTVPESLTGIVSAVSGLSSISSLRTYDHEDGAKPAKAAKKATARAKAVGTGAPPADAFVNAPPCSSYFAQKEATGTPKAYGKTQPYVTCGYTPAQLEGAYGLTSSIAKGFDGSGVTVAITDAYASPTILSDANTYAYKHGQEPFGKKQFSQVLPKSYRYGYDDTVNGDQCGEQGWYGEETLDVEAVHAVAPGADVKYVASRSCDNADFGQTLNKIVDRHLADIVTNSWGGIDESNGSAALDSYYQSVFYQGALEGIGFYFSSGDNGDGSAVSPDGNPTPEAPANSTLVTAVGGTSLEVGSRNQRLLETGWSTARSALSADGKSWDPAPPGTYQYGAGGGTSTVFDQPWYQKGVVPASLSKRYASKPARVVPDVSAVGDPNTGMLIGQTQTFPDGSVKYSEYRLGGTSLASPLFAGMMSIADQVAGHAHGFANPALYAQYGRSALYDPTPIAGAGVVRVDYNNTVDASDGTTTSLRSFDVETGTILRTRKGYDDITGIGSVNAPAFFAALS